MTVQTICHMILLTKILMTSENKEHNVAQEYKITRISQDPPREWNNPKGGTIYYKKVMLEGWDKPVSIGKKSPDALKVGDTVYGTIEIAAGYPEDKFKAEQNPNYGGGSGGQGQGAPRREYVDHHEDIKAQWSIGQAVQLLKDSDKTPSNQSIELWADTFYAMVERVKNGEKPQEAPKTVVPEPIDNDDAEVRSLVSKGIQAQDDLGEEPINIDDIPF